MDIQTGVSNSPPLRHTGSHPTIFEPLTLALIAVLCVIGAIIGMQLLVTLGVTANTSIVGALIAMALARVPIRAFARYRSIHVQNLAQSAISAATFGAGNSLLLPIGIPFLMGLRTLFCRCWVALLWRCWWTRRCYIGCSARAPSLRRVRGRPASRRRKRSAPAMRAGDACWCWAVACWWGSLAPACSTSRCRPSA